MPQPIGSQRKNAAQRLEKGDIRHFVATGVEQVSEGAMIRLHAALVCQEHVAHEDDGGMGDQSIEITALNFLGKFQGNYGDVVDKSDLNIDAPDHIHAVSSVVRKGQTHAYDYDANGNQTAGPDLTDPVAAPVRTLTFNADNMPTQVVHPQGGTINLTYDGNSQRAKKAGPTGTTYYFSNHFEIVDNSEICYVFAGNQRVAMVKDHTSTAYFHKDHLGSSTVLTRTDGTMIESTRYMPFGGQRGSGGISTTAYKFTDQELDAETNLYNYDARLYDPVVGRFVSADSVVPDKFDSQSWNAYSYCQNNPIKYNDPSGHSEVAVAMEFGWGIALIEPTPFGEVAMAVVSAVVAGVAIAEAICNNNEDDGVSESNSESENSTPGDPNDDEEDEDGKPTKAPKSASNFSRALQPGDLGIKGKLSQLKGIFSIKDGQAVARIDMIEGKITNPNSIIKNLTETARSQGATSLRIEGTIANERLYNVLAKRYGLQTSGATDFITIPLKK